MAPRLSLAIAACAVVAAAAASSTPNVLFIAVDDLRPEHGVFGGRAITPRIDAFARTAAVFHQNNVQMGVCSPTRASLLTGRYPDTTRINDLWHYFRTSGANVTTLPQTFREAGYVTKGSGKIYHPGHASGAGEYKPGSPLPNPCGIACSGQNDPPSWGGYYTPTSNALSPWNITYGESWIAVDEAEMPESVHPDAQTAAFIAEQIAAVPAGGSFFLAAGFYKPHLPFIFPAHYLALYDNMTDLASDAEPPSDGPEAPMSWTGWSEVKSYADIAAIVVRDNLTEALKAPCNRMPRDKALELRRAYFAATSFNDACVGIVLDALKASGHEDDTIVMLWGDHGWQLGDHGDWGKHTNFEDVVRAPLLIRAPSLPSSAGASISALTQHIDVFPTLLELAGLPPDPTLQGESLVPLLANPALPALPKRGAAAYSQYPRDVVPCPPQDFECGYPKAMGYTLRTPDWRFTEWVAYDNATFTPHWGGPLHQVELYDHRGDTGAAWERFENANVAGDAANAATVATLRAMLRSGPNLLHPQAP